MLVVVVLLPLFSSMDDGEAVNDASGGGSSSGGKGGKGGSGGGGRWRWSSMTVDNEDGIQWQRQHLTAMAVRVATVGVSVWGRRWTKVGIGILDTGNGWQLWQGWTIETAFNDGGGGGIRWRQQRLTAFDGVGDGLWWEDKRAVQEERQLNNQVQQEDDKRWMVRQPADATRQWEAAQQDDETTRRLEGGVLRGIAKTSRRDVRMSGRRSVFAGWLFSLIANPNNVELPSFFLRQLCPIYKSINVHLLLVEFNGSGRVVGNKSMTIDEFRPSRGLDCKTKSSNGCKAGSNEKRLILFWAQTEFFWQGGSHGHCSYRV
jgi:hypothetical protein